MTVSYEKAIEYINHMIYSMHGIRDLLLYTKHSVVLVSELSCEFLQVVHFSEPAMSLEQFLAGWSHQLDSKL